ncbi:MAG: hypothetical protein AAF717_11230 [Bacteroidota bacterium]
MKKENQKNTFKTPEGYFDSFNERLMARLADEEKVKSDIIPLNDGFVVPEHYFETVYDNVKNRLQGKGAKVIALGTYRTVYYAAAAVIALLVLTVAWNWSSEPQLRFEDLASTDITSYLESNDLGLSSYEIAEVVDLEEINLSDIMETQLEEEVILDYLNENVEEIEELNLEYDEIE